MFNLLGDGVIFYFDMTSNLERSCKNSPRKTHIQIHQQTSSLLSAPLVCVSVHSPLRSPTPTFQIRFLTPTSCPFTSKP